MTEAEWLASDDLPEMFAYLMRGNVSPSSAGGQGWRCSIRKVRLFFCAIARLINADELTECGHEIINTAEAYADDLISHDRFIAAQNMAAEIGPMLTRGSIGDHTRGYVLRACFGYKPVDWVTTAGNDYWADLDKYDILKASVQADILRDIVGNPFQPITIFNDKSGNPLKMRQLWQEAGRPLNLSEFAERSDVRQLTGCPSWLTPQVGLLAEAAYIERVRPCTTCNDMWPDICSGPCRGKGVINNGTLDPARLLVLSDALEEAGCIEQCNVCNENGFVTIYADNPSFPKNLGSATHLFASGIPRLCSVCKGDKEIIHPIVAHLRLPGPHVRGCCANDCLLGKE